MNWKSNVRPAPADSTYWDFEDLLEGISERLCTQLEDELEATFTTEKIKLYFNPDPAVAEQNLRNYVKTVLTHDWLYHWMNDILDHVYPFNLTALQEDVTTVFLADMRCARDEVIEFQSDGRNCLAFRFWPDEFKIFEDSYYLCSIMAPKTLHESDKLWAKIKRILQTSDNVNPDALISQFGDIQDFYTAQYNRTLIDTLYAR